MSNGNVKMALSSIRNAKWRSLMTMFGVIIGVVSVVTTVSLGEGVKQQVVNQIEHIGSDLITVRPGKSVTRDKNGDITGVNFFSGMGASTLTEQDLKIVQETPNIKVAVPLNLITGVAQVGDKELDGGLIIATTEGAPEILNQKVGFGAFFNNSDDTMPVAVIGKRVAEQLFEENVPVGKVLKLRGEEFVVRGVFEEFETTPLATNSDFNSAIFIPYGVGKRITDGSVQIYQILAKPNDASQIQPTLTLMQEALLKAHAGQEDFTILKQSETLTIATNILNLITGLIAGIAAISLIVGGIGIMNIMLVSVTERTHEIGIRKAIGATNRQILSQFLIEAMVLSLLGGLIGVLLSSLTNFLLRIFTDLQPIITLPVIGVACGASLIVGVIFGLAPAIKAAHKDPIEALRSL